MRYLLGQPFISFCPSSLFDRCTFSARPLLLALSRLVFSPNVRPGLALLEGVKKKEKEKEKEKEKKKKKKKEKEKRRDMFERFGKKGRGYIKAHPARHHRRSRTGRFHSSTLRGGLFHTVQELNWLPANQPEIHTRPS